LAAGLTAYAISRGNTNRYPQTIEDFARQYIDNLVQGLTVGVFPYGIDDDYFYIRHANILETRINTLEPEYQSGGIELWRLDFMVLTDDLEDGYIRWGTFFPDEDGWVGQHTAWNEAQTLLAFAVDGDEVTFVRNFEWWFESSHSMNELADIARISLLEPIPYPETHQNVPTNIQTMFMQNIDDIENITGAPLFVEPSDLYNNSYTFKNGLTISTGISNQVLSIFVDYNQTSDHTLFNLTFIDGTSTKADVVRRFGDRPANIRAGIDEERVGAIYSYGFWDRHRVFARFFFNAEDNVVAVSLFDSEHHYPAVWRDISYRVETYSVGGFGGRINVHMNFENEMPLIYFSGHMNIPQINTEFIEGSATITQDSMHISFVVARNDIIMDYTDDCMGTPAGPWVQFEYIPEIGVIGLTNHPYEFNDNRHEPLYFDFTEESAEALAAILRQALHLVDDYKNNPSSNE